MGPVVNGAIVCSASWLASLWGHSAVGEWHAVGRAIGLALIAVLVVDHVILWLAALDLIIKNKKNPFTIMTNNAAAVYYQLIRAATKDYSLN